MTPGAAGERVGGRIAVRPPALVEAAQGVRAAARCAEQAAADLTGTVAAAGALGAARPSFEAMGQAWIVELRLLLHDVGALAGLVEAAAGDYVRTDVAAGGRGRA